MSSQEMPLSSDNSESIYVVSDRYMNPWGNMPVDNIPLEIVEDLHTDSDASCDLIDVDKGPSVPFRPLSDKQCRLAAFKFFLILTPANHVVNFAGVGKNLSTPPIVTIAVKGNVAYLFNSMSILLTGRDTYNAAIHHAICNYIASPLNESLMKSYIQHSIKMERST